MDRQPKEDVLMGVSGRGDSRWGMDFGKMVCSWVMSAVAMASLLTVTETGLIDGSQMRVQYVMLLIVRDSRLAAARALLIFAAIAEGSISKWMLMQIISWETVAIASSQRSDVDLLFGDHVWTMEMERQLVWLDTLIMSSPLCP